MFKCKLTAFLKKLGPVLLFLTILSILGILVTQIYRIILLKAFHTACTLLVNMSSMNIERKAWKTIVSIIVKIIQE